MHNFKPTPPHTHKDAERPGNQVAVRRFRRKCTERIGTPATPLRSKEEGWKLVMDNYPLVLKAAIFMGLNRSPNAGREDAMQNALLSAHRTALLWDPGKGEFSPYLFISMKKAWGINRDEKLPIRIPASAVNRLARFNRWKERRPACDLADYAEQKKLSLNIEEKLRVAAAVYECSLNPPDAEGLFYSSTGSFPEEEVSREALMHSLDPLVEEKMLPGFEERIGLGQVAQLLKQAIKGLRPREAQIIEMRFGLGGEEPLTLVELGQSLGITAERVRQLEERALNKLRRCCSRKNLRPDTVL